MSACQTEGAANERPPRFDGRGCATLTERVLLDGELADERIAHIERLIIEDVALKLEAMLGADAAPDDGD